MFIKCAQLACRLFRGLVTSLREEKLSGLIVLDSSLEIGGGAKFCLVKMLYKIKQYLAARS